MHDKNLMSGNPAIIITVYDRRDHLKQCLESIEAAEGAEFYHVIVGSDAPAKKEHFEKITKVREYLKEKEKNHSFKKLSVIYHDVNVGENENFLKSQLLSKTHGHQSFIMMEDDVIVGRYFLDFMNSSLIKFIDHDDVILINGYLDNSLKTKDYNPFLYNRCSAYGFASWYKKWDMIEERRKSINYAARTLADLNLFKKLSILTPNAKSYPFLAEDFYKAADIEIGLMMELECLWALLPPVSLTANRGMDGSGLRSGADPVLQAMEPSHEKIEVTEPSNIKRFKLEEIKDKIQFKYIAANWFSFIVYKYIPFGFEILKRLRTIKKSL